MNEEPLNEESLIFALDIGTRSVVGIAGYAENGVFHVVDFEQSFHSRRAMRDGQIEDIDLVSRVVTGIKETLEERLNTTFKKVSIAAAGRSLKTVTSSFEQNLSENGQITKELIRFMESSAIGTAQEKYANSGFQNDINYSYDLDSSLQEAYYCVGYSVLDYSLDGYSMSNLEGHRGSVAKVEIIAAFLPFSVVRSLYAVTSRSGLDVDNLTLEPIAAINVIVPPDVRLLNIALVDIGAGTSDIAISKNGSIIAYDMVTIAGDEISEAIMKNFLTDFNTAEEIKMSLSDKSKKTDKISFSDILGNVKGTSVSEIEALIKPQTEQLCDSICDMILKINETPPAAVFLVGGGSQVPDLCQMVAKKMELPEDRVALGGTQGYKYVELCNDELKAPSFVTPLGIATVSTLYRGCDFFSITVNDRKIMLFSHGTIKVLDALLLAGIKPSRLISVVPPSVSYYINGEKFVDRGTPGNSGQLFVNGMEASIDTAVKQGDVVEAIYAENGVSPTISIINIVSKFTVDSEYPVLKVLVNGKEIDFDFNIESDIEPKVEFQTGQGSSHNYRIKSMDNIDIIFDETQPKKKNIPETAIAEEAPTAVTESILSAQENHFLKKESDEVKATSDLINELDKSVSSILKDEAALVSEILSDPQVGTPIALHLTVNGKPLKINGTKEEPPQFLSLLNYVDLDTKNPQGDLVLTLNGLPASYMDYLKDGDQAVIKFNKE